MTEFSIRLKEMRERNGLSQSDVAKELGITQNAIYRYENDLSWPPMSALIYFADKYSCSVDYLLGRTNVVETVHDIHVLKDDIKHLYDYFFNIKK